MPPPRPVAKSLLFADVRGYSKLTEYQIGRFLEVVAPSMAAVIHEAAPVYRNTWGDAIFAVFDTPQQAANCALDLCQYFHGTHWADLGFHDNLAIRVSLHFGTCFFGTNPITRREEYIGTNVNLAARIEPIVRPNEVWATERFVRSLEEAYLGNLQHAALGRLELVKGWGVESLTCLSRYPIGETTLAWAREQAAYAASPMRMIQHVNLPVTDLEASTHFYKDVLRFHELPQAEDGEIAGPKEKRPWFGFPGKWLQLPNGQQVHLILHEPANPPVTFRNEARIVFKDVHLCFQVRDFDEMRSSLRKHQLVKHSEDGPLDFQFYILDPDNHIIEINGKDGPRIKNPRR